MISIDALIQDFNALSPAQQVAQWDSFTADLDAGSAGFHRYYPVLMPLWDRGDEPDEIEALRQTQHETEARADALWELQHPFPDTSWEDYDPRRLYPAAGELELAELPF
jgi:hypothetical protein